MKALPFSPPAARHCITNDEPSLSVLQTNIENVLKISIVKFLFYIKITTKDSAKYGIPLYTTPSFLTIVSSDKHNK